jgi:hypothetical protein
MGRKGSQVNEKSKACQYRLEISVINQFKDLSPPCGKSLNDNIRKSKEFSDVTKAKEETSLCI